jgi:hypothetical protein
MLEEEITKSHFVVHIIGAEPGWTPPPDQANGFLDRHPSFAERFPEIAKLARAGSISATQWEAWLALHLGKRLYSYELPKRMLDGSPQKLHSSRLHAAHEHPKAIENEDALFDEVIGSLIERGLLTKAEIERKIAPSRILRHSPPKLFGRDHWLDTLDAARAKPTLNVYTLVAWGGVGKTSLVAHWVSERLAAKGWPGVERYFDWSFYSQGTGESRQTSSDLFIQEALKFFDDPDPIKGSPWERGERLAGLIRRHRTLLVLDGIEPLQYPPSDPQAGRLKDQALDALLLSLAGDNPGLCVVTTREHLKNIENQATTEERKLEKLPKEAAIALLRHLQVVGTGEEMEAAWEAADGHALTLRLLGRLLVRAYGKDIRKWREINFEKADKLVQDRTAFKVIKKYEQWLLTADIAQHLELAVLQLTGLFDRPITPDCFQALRKKPAIHGLTDALANADDLELEVALDTLIANDLLSHSDDDKQLVPTRHQDQTIDAHPLIREYFAKQLRGTQPAAFQAAHSRLFDHLSKTTPYRPDTLEGLQPLYQAVVHGCLAGRQQEACGKVYADRILRGWDVDGFYSIKQLGAIGADLAALVAFFDEPWNGVSLKLSEAYQAWLLSGAAFDLRALGRLTEALRPMRTALEMAVQRKNWRNAAISASSLGELEVTLGRLPDAMADARTSITHADKSGNAFMRMSSRAWTADAMHQSGKREEAGKLFAEAERIQKEREPKFNLLYSLAGFQYCDWLLTPAERASWQAVLGGMSLSPVLERNSQHGYSKICAEVERRGERMFDWRMPNDPILDIALDHLTLARVRLVKLILTHLLPQPTLNLPQVTAAVNGLRKSGNSDKVPNALLTAALYHFVRGEHDTARARLDEAQQIAERGPMLLYLADVHLHRARLFRDRAELANAAKLIRDLGYGRRYDELAHAEEASKSWAAEAYT